MQTNYPETGFIFLHRRIRKHWLWTDAEKLKWWLDILMEANHSDNKVLIGGKLIDCQRGQSLNSLQTWAIRWRTNVSAVRRFFNLLEADTMIQTENVGKTTRLTVCNYDDYNETRQGGISKSTRKRQDNDTKMSTKTTQTTVWDSTTSEDQRHDDDTEMKRKRNGNETEMATNNNVNNNDSIYTDQQKEQFANFQNWVSKNAPEVAKMKHPFTIDQYLTLKSKHSTETICDIIEQMDNWEPLLKKRTHAYKTFNSFIKNRELRAA